MQFENQKVIEEQVEEELAAARIRREKERAGRAMWFFFTNEERLEKIKSWYPYVYQMLKKNFPLVCENPDDYPAAVIGSFNQLLMHKIPCGDYSELHLTV